ncbi:MAG: DHA2 family efflux MFS transporter permease subunit [Myxococcaceae bacterium]|nr:DHA2 family efflux MFS transporter permease subunit [Myxococcaceae bacterium]
MTALAVPLDALPAPRRRTNKWVVALSVTFGTLMGAIDASIVNVALSQIRGSVGATVQEITWISTGFAIATVMVMPLTGFFGRLFGQKNVYLACLLLFILGSALCGVAWNLPSLIVFRALQGFGAGALQPTEQAILRQTFPPKEQATAMALFAMAVMVGPAVGPTLGGFIVDNFHWSWIFFINVPVGILGMFLVWRFVEEPEDIKAHARAEAQKMRAHMDWLGIALLWTCLGALQYVLEEGQGDDWFESPLIVVVTLLALFTAVAFVVRELTAQAPAVNLRLFKDATFTSGALASAAMFAVMMSGMFLLPLFMQELLGFTAMQSGLALMPRTLVMLVCMPVVAKIYAKVPPWFLGTSGLLLNCYGQFMLAGLNLSSSTPDIIAAIVSQGAGMSLMMVPLQTISLSTIPRHQMADATGLSSLIRQIGSSLGLAAFATLLTRYGVFSRDGLRAHILGERPEVLARLAMAENGLVARGVDANSAHGAALGSLYGAVARQGMVLAFDKLFIAGGILFLCVVPLMFMLRAPKQGAAPSAPVHVEME